MGQHIGLVSGALSFCCCVPLLLLCVVTSSPTTFSPCWKSLDCQRYCSCFTLLVAGFVFVICNRFWCVFCILAFLCVIDLIGMEVGMVMWFELFYIYKNAF